ncbi:MAG: hypothetical protein U0271_14370 [Polyangiaceae bacterium]
MARKQSHVLSAIACAALLMACGDDTTTSGGGGAGASNWTGGGGSGQGGTMTSTGGGGSGTGGEVPVTECIAASAHVDGSDTWQDNGQQATVTVQSADTCARTYQISTTAPLRDNVPANPRSVVELAGQPVVRTGNDMFDALYALAIDESREASVDAISNFAFNGGAPIPCPAGGCFETGRLWTYVWTRDTSYAVALGLGAADPTRARNSLEFKTSLRRDGTRREIVQDTGTGGSWPVSTDRVVWALGAWELAKYLDGAERSAFITLALDAIVNTAHHDRAVAFDATDGLYRGEQSFLDWREQTYPDWTKTDTVQIGMSKSLSTNIGHLRLLEIGAAFATEQGNTAEAATLTSWADDLRASIRARLWLESDGLYSTYQTTYLDPSPVHRYDLLGEAFSILYDVATPAQAKTIVSSYPHFTRGAPVAFPEQQDTPIYHNRAIWPFVTAFWARAAAKAGHAPAVDHAVRSLMRGAALNLSNMENFEAVTGAAWLDDGAASGPVVNSQRQLWSVGGYLGVVDEVVFGREVSQTGIRFLPKLTAGLRASLFSGVDTIALSGLQYRGKRVSVVLHLPAASAQNGFYTVSSAKLDGNEVGSDFVPATSLLDGSVFDLTLSPGAASNDPLTELDDAAVADYKNLFGPKTPSITNLSLVANKLSVDWSAAGETGVKFNVYRDGVAIATNLTATTFSDPNSTDHASVTHCYSVESVFDGSGTTSQHARPVCYWGANSVRVKTFDAQTFVAVGGQLVFNHGRWHYEDWGDPGDSLTVSNVVPTMTGEHLIQVLAGNGAGDFTTGVTCGVKVVEVWDGPNMVGSGQLVMPHLATWDDWRDSNFVRVTLTAGKSYTIVIREDGDSGNMSDLDHFSLYGGTGGTGGRFDKVNIAEVKVLAVGP